MISKKGEKKVKGKKKVNKKIIISAIIGIAIVFSIGGVFLLKSKNQEKKLKESWSEVYYQYLLEIKTKNAKQISKMKDAKINFYEIKGRKDPILVISYEKEKVEYSKVFYLNNKEVKELPSKVPSEVEFLYKIEDQSYDYYRKTTDNKEIYQLVSELIENDNRSNTKSNTTYEFEKDDKETVTDTEGKEISISKFDQTFIKIEPKEEDIPFSKDLTKEELKKNIDKAVSHYNKQQKIIEQVAEKMEKKLEEVLKKQEEIKKVREEIEKKKEEENKNQQKEETKKEETTKIPTEGTKQNGVTVGGTLVKYGTYKGIDGATGDTLILRSNGTAFIYSTEYTYKIEQHNFAQDISSNHYQMAIVFYNSDGTVASALYPYNNNLMDGGINTYIFSGE